MCEVKFKNMLSTLREEHNTVLHTMHHGKVIFMCLFAGDHAPGAKHTLLL